MRAHLLVVVLMAGCFSAPSELDIPCDGDESCPTGFWCTDALGCASLQTSSPPELALVGVGDPPAASIEVPVGTFSFFDVVIRNAGGAEASGGQVVGTGPECLGLGLIVDIPYGFAPGAQLWEKGSVNPDQDCDSPARVTVDMSPWVHPDFAHDRTTVATFDVIIID